MYTLSERPAEWERLAEGRVPGQSGLLFVSGGECADGALQADFTT